MLTTLKNAFKIKEIRQKILFTLGMLVVIRIGSQLPVPGVDTKFFSQWFAQQTGGAFSFFDAITGGFFPEHVYSGIEHQPLYYIFHYHAAAYNCYSKAGRNAA